ncbi:MAG: glycosyl transferase family protein [Chloroflexi bacterium OLB15]|nr:MAG: glycosyl transferase family protein [Chloroflexi bacterium OLB15]
MQILKPKQFLWPLVAVYVVLAIIYSIITPIFEASDELWHYPMVEYIATNNFNLPVQDSANETALRQEGSQPPLYYLAAALLTAGIDSSNLDFVRRQNPHADIGFLRPDGNANMITHRDNAESFPWRGAALAVHVARLFSVILGAGTVIVTFALASVVFPDRPVVIVGATALNAFLPMFLFISGSVNNDNMSNLLGNLLCLLIVLLLRSTQLPRWRDYVIIGLVAGAGLLAKLNIGFLIPLVGVAFLILSIRLRDWRPLVWGALISGGITILVAGWWYLRNWQLYGDPTGLNVFLDLVGRRAIPPNAAQLWAERFSFTQGYWGFFGGMNVPMPDPVYTVFNVIGVIGLMGAAVFMLATLFKRSWPVQRWLLILPPLLWSIITFVSFIRWTAETPASQGRLVFGALSAISMFMALGLTWWWPKMLRPAVMGAVSAYFLVVAALAPFMVIAPTYAKPERLAAQEPLAIFHDPQGRGIALSAFSIREDTVTPDSYVWLDMRWQIDLAVDQNWSLFAHLVTPDNVLIAQRDLYPGGGLLATSDLNTGIAWDSQVAIPIPDTAYAPMPLTVEVGWYNLETGERLHLSNGDEAIVLGQVQLEPRESVFDVPNPGSLNFGNLLELVGYEISDISPGAGGETTLTLFWRALQAIPDDYTIFAHIIDPATTAIYAGSDAQPAGGTRPTSGWQQGEIIEDVHTLAVNPDTPPAIYELEIGAYIQIDDLFQRLRLVTVDGGMANDYAYLTRVRVMPREDDAS